MKITMLIVAITLCCINGSSQNLPKVSSGTLKRIENFHSDFVERRNIDVWLPEGYDGVKRYSVLYMHDGQMLYDSTTTWNKKSWNADVVLAKLQKEGRIKDVILVGIWSSVKYRHRDYFPQKPFESMTKEEQDFVTIQLQGIAKTKESFQPISDNYLKFLVTELKPFIDNNFNVFKDKSHTFVAGSSMGGLISIYAICEYPDVFGGAACMSTHWPGIFSMESNPIPDTFVNYLKKYLPDPQTHKIYFDYGDQTLDAMYPPLQKKVDEVMKAKGFMPKNWMTRYFPGKDHSENSWGQRLNIPLGFMLNN